ATDVFRLPTVLYAAPLVAAGVALWLLCKPRSQEVVVGAPLPSWIVPLAVVSGVALEALLASASHTARLLLSKITLGRGLGELGLFVALCVASRLPSRWRALTMPALAGAMVTLVAALGGSALLLTGSSVAEGLWLVFAAGVIF